MSPNLPKCGFQNYPIDLYMKHFKVIFCILVSSCLAEESPLRKLAYNEPDLTVDLGVGLWSWPMPIDFDEDGDLDLLVACDDKPSNGFYFFENPGVEPGEKLPIFKKAVRLGAGKAKKNFQMSYVDGQPRLLLENLEFPNFREGDFETTKEFYPTRRIDFGWTRGNMFRLCDWEGDGDLDFIAGVGVWSDYGWDHAYDQHGKWQNGPLHGYVYLVERDGTEWKKPRKLLADGVPMDVYGWPSPNLRDFDGDGDLDLLCGEFLDGFTYFENTGSRSKPVYASGVKLAGADGEPLTMHLQMITPTAYDWDADGDYDLIVGDEDGRVAFVENVSQEGDELPVFHQPVYFQQEADTLKFGALVTPFAVDWDDDGDEDLLCGNSAGNIALFNNLDGKGTRWSAPEMIKADGADYRQLAGESGSIQGPAEAKWGYTTLSVADWDEDGHRDIVVNGIWPKLQLLKGSADGTFSQEPLPFWSSEEAPDFYWWNREQENFQTQWRTTPMAMDFDEDGSIDLVALDQDGYLTLQSRNKQETRIFIDEDNKPVRFAKRSAGKSGRTKFAVADWDGDGRLDFLVNSENAAWYRNCETRDGRIVLKHVGNLTDLDVSGHSNSPTVVDFDKNGKPDLVIGSENGRLYHIRHEDCIQYTTEEITARPPTPPQKPRFTGLISESTITQKPFHHNCNAITSAFTTRGLVTAWSTGKSTNDAHAAIWSAYYDGEVWSKPRKLIEGIQNDQLRYPVNNPVLYQHDSPHSPLLLFFETGDEKTGTFTEARISYDRGRFWRERVRLPDGVAAPQQGGIKAAGPNGLGLQVLDRAENLTAWSHFNPFGNLVKYEAMSEVSANAFHFTTDEQQQLAIPTEVRSLRRVDLDSNRVVVLHQTSSETESLTLSLTQQGMPPKTVAELPTAFAKASLSAGDEGEMHLVYIDGDSNLKHLTFRF